MTTPSLTAEEIAGKLTEAQRRWLVGAFYGRGGWRIVGYRKKACDLGLCHPGTSLITPLGHKVRAILRINPNA
jgi:hypothetical protein